MDEPAEPAPPRRPTPWVSIVAWLAVVLALGWFAAIGYHRHELKVTANGRTVRFVSRRPSWDVTRPGAPPPARQWYLGGHDATLTHARQVADGQDGSAAIAAESVSGVGIIETTQNVEARGRDVRLDFTINGRAFEWRGTELRCGERRWELPADAPLEIDVDELP